MPWSQVYDPMGKWWFSTLLASIPVVVLLGTLAFLHIKAHWAALLGLATSLAIAIVMFGMPARMAFTAAGYGAAYGLLPIGWIIPHVLFFYSNTMEKGRFKIFQGKTL